MLGMEAPVSIIMMSSEHPSVPQTALAMGPSHFLNGHLDLGFGGFAFALKLPEWLNTNLVTVRAKLEQTPSFPNLVSIKAMNLGDQLGPMGITKLSTNWAYQMGSIHFPKLLLSWSFSFITTDHENREMCFSG